MSNKTIVSDKFKRKKKKGEISFEKKKVTFHGNAQKKLTLLTLLYSFVDTKIAQESENVLDIHTNHMIIYMCKCKKIQCVYIK